MMWDVTFEYTPGPQFIVSQPKVSDTGLSMWQMRMDKVHWLPRGFVGMWKHPDKYHAVWQMGPCQDHMATGTVKSTL